MILIKSVKKYSCRNTISPAINISSALADFAGPTNYLWKGLRIEFKTHTTYDARSASNHSCKTSLIQFLRISQIISALRNGKMLLANLFQIAFILLLFIPELVLLPKVLPTLGNLMQATVIVVVLLPYAFLFLASHV